jgi:hypothetical protein
MTPESPNQIDVCGDWQGCFPSVLMVYSQLTGG